MEAAYIRNNQRCLNLNMEYGSSIYLDNRRCLNMEAAYIRNNQRCFKYGSSIY